MSNYYTAVDPSKFDGRRYNDYLTQIKPFERIVQFAEVIPIRMMGMMVKAEEIQKAIILDKIDEGIYYIRTQDGDFLTVKEKEIAMTGIVWPDKKTFIEYYKKKES